MGEAKRRRDYEKAHADEIAADRERRRAHRALIDEIASEDPDDRACRLAHGFTRDDDWQDRTVLCRNGCGASYLDVVSGKMRNCSAATGALTWLQAKLDSGEGDDRVRDS